MGEPAAATNEEDDPLAHLTPEARAAAMAYITEIRRPLSKGDPRLHHYVPKRYQARFANDKNQVIRTNVASGDEVTVSIGANAAIRDFYTVIDSEVGDTVSVEKILSQIDGADGHPMDRLIHGVLFPPQPRDRFELANFIGLLAVRGPHTRRTIEAIGDMAFKMQLSLIHDKEDRARNHLRARTGTEPTDEEVRKLLDVAGNMDDWEVAPHQNEKVRSMLTVGQHLAEGVFARTWVVVRFPEPGPVITDNPVTMNQHPENWHPLRGVGYGTADELWLPLDRQTALLMHLDDDSGDQVVAAPPGITVDGVNQLVVSQAFTDVYCHPDDVERVRRLKFPDPNRPISTLSGAEFMRGSTDGINAAPVRRAPFRYKPGRD